MSDDTLVGDKKAYEIAFILSGDAAVGEIEKTLLANGAEMMSKSPVAAIKLAYPVKKHASGYFGYMVFSAIPANVKTMKDALTLQQGVLRSLIIAPPIKAMSRDSQGMRVRETRAAAPREAQKEAAPSVQPAAEAEARQARPAPEVLSNELLEKKLEEILK